MLCTASVGESVPPWLQRRRQGLGDGGIRHAAPRHPERTRREAATGKQSGRTQEIQRLIGRSLRAVIDLTALGERQITLDCDVLQADGGTRTASITGAWIALHDAVAWMKARNMLEERRCLARSRCRRVLRAFMAARPILDLDYAEDSEAQADANFVMTGLWRHRRGAGHRRAASLQPRRSSTQLMALAKRGIAELVQLQKLTVA